MIAFSRSSYSAMRVRYCCTSSRDVMRRCWSARCRSVMEASTTVNRAGADGAAAKAAAAASTRMSPLVFIGSCRGAECTACLLQQVGLDESIQIAVEYPVDVADLHFRAMVLDHLIRL